MKSSTDALGRQPAGPWRNRCRGQAEINQWSTVAALRMLAFACQAGLSANNTKGKTLAPQTHIVCVRFFAFDAHSEHRKTPRSSPCCALTPPLGNQAFNVPRVGCSLMDKGAGRLYVDAREVVMSLTLASAVAKNISSHKEEPTTTSDAPELCSPKRLCIAAVVIRPSECLAMRLRT
jgi:hypothetical protein